uniref:Uncharacterized protein n=1 Tax=Helianthus annuus TaxID=4232 RepID=A0A251T559_HELAN
MKKITLIFAMILGLGSNAFSDKVDSLRKKGILVWVIVFTFKAAGNSKYSIGGVVVVVLAERDKQDMDIVKLEYRFMATLVICRSSFGFEGTSYNCTRSR